MHAPSSPTLADMRATAQRLAPHVLRTPVVPLHGRYSQALLAGPAAVHLKLELLQRTGTFKARGALNAVMALSAEQCERGITAVSAGNHAIAAAFAAQAAGLSAKLVVQDNANPVRVAITRSYGAEVVLAPAGAAAFARADALVRDEGRVMIHPFEGPNTALGTATLGLELIEQLPELDAVVVAIGGGGLAGGMAAAIHALRPQCRIYGVQPEGSNAMQQSFASGQTLSGYQVNTIADSLGPPLTLPYSLALCRAHIERIVIVSDDDICRALAVLFHDAKLAVEPAGAAALAGAMGPLHDLLAGQRVAVIVCGANIDAEGYARWLIRGQALLNGDPKP